MPKEFPEDLKGRHLLRYGMTRSEEVESITYNLTPGLDAYGHLWVAVLRQAIDDATMEATTSEADVERRRARLWLKQQIDTVGSLRWICDILNIDVTRILSEFENRCQSGGIRRRRRAVAFAYHKRKQA